MNILQTILNKKLLSQGVDVKVKILEWLHRLSRLNIIPGPNDSCFLIHHNEPVVYYGTLMSGSLSNPETNISGIQVLSASAIHKLIEHADNMDFADEGDTSIFLSSSANRHFHKINGHWPDADCLSISVLNEYFFNFRYAADRDRIHRLQIIEISAERECLTVRPIKLRSVNHY